MATIKRISKKFIILILIFITLFNLVKPNYVYAAEDKEEASWLGILTEPIAFLVSAMGDGIIRLTQSLMLPGTGRAVYVESGETKVNIIYGPAAIFSNVVPMLDINFLSPSVKNQFLTSEVTDEYLKEEGYSKNTREKILAGKQAQDANSDDQYIKIGNAAAILNKSISKWYVALRNLAILGLLVVLVYIGIRILIATSSEEKADYKKMIKNWLMSIILVVTIHYIILALITITQMLVSILSSAGTVFNATEGDILMNTVRVAMANQKYFTVKRLGYAIMYFVLVIYTITFTVNYIKRVVYLAFLTLISTMVTLTYPLDKIKDGRSQAFNMWFKEFLFNLLIQPIHLLLYIVLVSAAIELAKSNMVYALVAIGFILQAETFVKQMFGIKAEGGAAAGNFAAGMAFSSVMGTMQKGSAGLSKMFGGESSKKPRLAGGSGGSSAGTGGSSGGKSLSAFGGNEKAKKQNKVGIGNKVLNKVGAPGRKVKGAVGKAKSGVNNVKTKASDTKKKIKNAAGNTAIGKGIKKYKGSKVGKGLSNVRAKYINSNLAKKANRLALKAYTGGMFGAMGVAAGLASNDFSNVWKMGSAGAVGGAMVGGAIGDATRNTKEKASEVKDTFQQGYYGDEYQEKENERTAKKMEKDPDMQSKLRGVWGNEWKDHKGDLKDYIDNGITDSDSIIKAMEKQKKINKSSAAQLSSKEMAQITAFTNNIERDDFMKHPEVVKQSIKNMGVPDDRIDEVFDLAMDVKGAK